MHNDTFPSHSNKRRTGTSRVLPPWFSRTPEGGRCASVFEFSLFIEKKCSSCCVEENESVCLFPPGPQTSARAEISEEMRGGSDHHRSVLARHPGTDIKEWGVCCTLMASAGEACSWTLVSIASNSLVFYCSLCSCLKAPQYCKTAVL